MTEKLHKARYVVSKFLNSRVSREYNLNGNARSLLRTIADLIDMNYRKFKTQECHKNRKHISANAGISPETYKRLIPKLNQLQLLKTKIEKGKEHVHTLGELLSTRVMVTRESGHGVENPGHSDPTYNISSNIYKNNGTTNTVKDYIQKQEHIKQTPGIGSHAVKEIVSNLKRKISS